MIIIIIKALLVIASILTVGLLPAATWLEMWIWNEIIIKHVITCGIPITSFWIGMGLTSMGGLSIGSLFKIFGRKKK